MPEYPFKKGAFREIGVNRSPRRNCESDREHDEVRVLGHPVNELLVGYCRRKIDTFLSEHASEAGSAATCRD